MNKRPVHKKPKVYKDYLQTAYEKGEVDEETLRQPKDTFRRSLVSHKP